MVPTFDGKWDGHQSIVIVGLIQCEDSHGTDDQKNHVKNPSCCWLTHLIPSKFPWYSHLMEFHYYSIMLISQFYCYYYASTYIGIVLNYFSWSSLGEDFKQIIACLGALDPSDATAPARFGFLLIALLLRDPKHLDHPEQPSVKKRVMIHLLRVLKGCIYLKGTFEKSADLYYVYMSCIMYLYIMHHVSICIYDIYQYNIKAKQKLVMWGASTPTRADLA